MPYGPPPWQPAAHPVRKSSINPFRKPGTKPVQVTVDLAPADYEVLKGWLARAAVELDQPASRMTAARAIRAMIQAAAADDAVNGVVLGLLRTDQS